MSFTLQALPPQEDLESRAVLKKAASAHRYLAELKGVSASIPNQGILINTLSIQEAKDSSAVENIITTHDDLFKDELFPDYAANISTKEVGNYVTALKAGFQLITDSSMLTNNHIQKIQALLENNQAGFRRLPGTALKNGQTGETVYTPPQNPAELLRLMDNLEPKLPDLKVPSLVVQSNGDPVVEPKGSRKIFDLIGSPDKEYVLP